MKKAYGFVVLTAFLFGTMEVACKVAGNQLDPFQLTFIRFAIGGLILLPFATVELRKAKIRLTARDLLRLAGVGILGISLQYGVFSAGRFQFQCIDCIGTDLHKSFVYHGIRSFLHVRKAEPT